MALAYHIIYRHVDQWDNTEDPNMTTHNYSHLIFDKDAKKYTLDQRQHLQLMVLQNLNDNEQKNEIRHIFITLLKN